MNTFNKYIQPGKFMDSDNQTVIDYGYKIAGDLQDPTQIAVELYYAIRDGFQYNPYKLDLSNEGMKASNLLTRNYGYCIEKANLLGACARVFKIASRLGFANVKNHIGTNRFRKILKTDVLVFHGYTELYLKNKWVKATPAFNKELCDKLNVAPLEFDGENDSIFQEYNRKGGKFMEYLHDYGTYNDIPYQLFICELKLHYPHMFQKHENDREKIILIK